MTRWRSILGWGITLAVGLPLLALASLVRVWKQRPRKTKREAPVPSRMSDPFDGHPPQGVVFECRKDNCSLHHEAQVQAFSQVEDAVAYYCAQGHQAIARFPAADDAQWPPDEACRED